jgi:hypothetical protein
MQEMAFEFVNPTEGQKATMGLLRGAAINYFKALDEMLPDGPDKTYALRKLREVAMWANVAVTRQPDGAARQ